MKDPTQQAEFTDGVFSFELGSNAGQSPLILPRNQLSSASNITVRGDFATHRPAYRKIALSYADPLIQPAFEGGLWQGGCFYNSDTGTNSLMAAIAGRLFQCAISGNTATVTEQTINGDSNPATASQAWLWQAENYIIWNDGQSLPVFWDGSTSRRSYGPAVNLGTVQTSFTVPAVGAVVPVTLASPYTGSFNVPLVISGAFYQVVSAATASSPYYEADLVNLYGDAGTVAVSTQIIAKPATAGLMAQAASLNAGVGFYPANYYPLAINLPSTISASAGTLLSITGTAGYTNGATIIWRIISINGMTVNVVNNSQIGSSSSLASGESRNNGFNYPAGTPVVFSGNATPNSTQAVIYEAFTYPAVGATLRIKLKSAYVGTANKLYIGTGKECTLTAVAPSPPTATINLINLTDIPNTASVPQTRAAGLAVTSLAELPAGRMGTYGMGRNWVSLTDGISFIAGDIVGGSSGTSALNYRDAVLKIQENSYLAGGGVFRVPGSIGDIRAMRFASTLDASLGQGPLQVFTSTTVFSCNAPVDRATWQNITNPILTESLIAGGALGQHSTIAANGDTFMRSVDGLRSLILARRDFSTWGNVPQSREVQPIIDADDASLLSFGSAIVFDNRLLYTASPVNSGNGVYHTKTIALNFDPLSSLRQKSQPVYDGVWDGLNVLQYITGLVNGVQRAFAFCLSEDLSTIELWEVLKTDSGSQDNGTDLIEWEFETASLFKEIKGKGLFDYCRLTDGEIGVDSINGPVTFEVRYRPDQSDSWTLWHSWTVDGSQKFMPRMGFGQPPVDADSVTGLPYRQGYTFQLKLRVTGSCRVLKMKVKAVSLPTDQFAKPL